MQRTFFIHRGKPFNDEDGITLFLELVEDFSEYLGGSDHELEETLKYLTLFTFAPLGCVGTFLSVIKLDGTAELICKFGLRKDIFDYFPTQISLSEDNPITSAVRNRTLVWIDETPNWGDSNTKMRNQEIESMVTSFICWPIERNRAPVATLSAFCSAEIDRTAEVSAFVKAINSIFSIFFNRLNNDMKDLHKDEAILNSARLVFEGRKLTERQYQILELMAQEKTNLAISQILGFSESTIRQESIRIYEKLRCDGRKEAAMLFNEIRKEAAAS